MTYRPIFRKQIGDPTTGWDSFICTMESGAMALDYHTRGAVQVWGGQLLATLHLSELQIKDGTNFDDLARAWANYGRTLDDRRGGSWQDVLRCLQEGRAVIAQGDYDQFTLATRCQDNFIGNHAVLILPEKNGGSWLVADPLCSDFKWVPEYEINRYLTKLSVSIFGPRSPQPLYFAVTNPQGFLNAPPPPDTSTTGGTTLGLRTENPRAIAPTTIEVDKDYPVAAIVIHDERRIPLPKGRRKTGVCLVYVPAPQRGISNGGDAYILDDEDPTSRDPAAILFARDVRVI